MGQNTLISIVGPTGIGKTSLAIRLAEHLKTEIVSADSRQFYKEMSIGTAVPSDAELGRVKHHFIQHKSVLDSYSVGDFERDAMALLEVLFTKYRAVVLVGGSGLYVDAVTQGLDKFPDVAPEIRNELNTALEEYGIGALQSRLQELDPVQYKKIDRENPHRLIRALEVCLGTGKPYSSFLGAKKPQRPFDVVTLGIRAEREVVYGRIDQRVDQMMASGLLDEARSLEKHKALNALQTVGYKELFGFFEGKWDLDFAVSEIKKNSRRFAKRQFTWFKKNEDTIWVDHDAPIHTVISQLVARLKLEGYE